MSQHSQMSSKNTAFYTLFVHNKAGGAGQPASPF